MAKLKEVESKLVQIPEWSMEFIATRPAVAEIEAMASHLLSNPDIAAMEGAVDNAALVLLARTKEGARHFDDLIVATLFTRNSEVIKRALTDCGVLYGEVTTALANLLAKKSTIKENDNAAADKG